MLPEAGVRLLPLRLYDWEVDGPPPTRYVKLVSVVGVTDIVGVGGAVTEPLQVTFTVVAPPPELAITSLL